MDSLFKDKPSIPLQSEALRPWLAPVPGVFSVFSFLRLGLLCLGLMCLGLLIIYFLNSSISPRSGPPSVTSTKNSASTLTQPGTGTRTGLTPEPTTGPTTGPTPVKQSQVSSQVLKQRFALALSNFSNSPVQNLHIISQSTADPAYNSPEKLLQYPAGAWEFTFSLDKAKGIFSYKEAMDGEQLSLLKKSGVLWTDEGKGKGWRKVKASKFSQSPYDFAKVKSLDKLPFLYLNPSYPISLQSSSPEAGRPDCDLVRIIPPQSAKGSIKPGTPEIPREILFWITSQGPPRLEAARYFWISSPPGGTLYTVNQVDF